MSEFDAFTRYYDADYGAIDDDIMFYRGLSERCGGPILEVMCGSGRLLLPLAQAGYRLTGLDISPALLGLARARLSSAGYGEQVELIEADIRTWRPKGAFSLAIVALNSFMHLLTSADQLAALSRIYAALKPGGLLTLDLFSPDVRALVNHVGELAFDRMFTLPDGTCVQKFVAQHSDIVNQLNHVTFFYDELDAEGRVRRCALPFTMRWIYRHELEHLLARAGFALESIYGSYDLDEYENHSEIMLAVARKL